jgi:hypothetical protein
VFFFALQEGRKDPSMARQNQVSHKNHPRVSYQQAKDSYFIHDGHVLSVSQCSASLFRDAVLALAPHWANNEDYNGFLAASKIDPVIRWYLLCSLSEAKRPLTLHGSRREAEQALSR